MQKIFFFFFKNGFQFVSLTAARAHAVLRKVARPTNRSVFPDSLVFGCTVSTRERAACRSLQIHYADTGSPLRLFVNTKSAAITLCKLGSNFLTALQADAGSGDHSSRCPLLPMFKRGGVLVLCLHGVKCDGGVAQDVSPCTAS